MGDRTLIEWTDATWNPITGCSPVSAGCANCYAARMVKRFPQLHGIQSPVIAPWAMEPLPFNLVRLHPSRLDIPLRWRKPRRIFVCSMGDLFHDDVKDEWIDGVFTVVALAPKHTFIMLTKRPERMRDYCRRAVAPFPNLWLGVTVEDSDQLYRAEYLMQTPAAKRFVSVEPCLGDIDFTGFLPGLDWIICGGETGPGARPMEYGWAMSLMRQCQDANSPFFFKGWGTHYMKKSHSKYMLLDGRAWRDFPAPGDGRRGWTATRE